MIGRPERRPGHPYLAGPPIHVAHRGGAALAPENTMEAFVSAVEVWGAEMLELDVHLTRDGEVVVIHDPTVDRTTDGSGVVAEMSWAELRRLDAGAQWVAEDGTLPFAGRGIEVPRLVDLLERLPHTRLNVEAKVRGVAAPLVDVVERLGAQRRVLLAATNESDRAHVAARFRSIGGPMGASRRQIAAFLLLARLPWLARTPAVEALQIPIRWPVAGRVRQILSEAVLREAHRRNVAVHIWTIDDVDTMRRLLDMGVDAIQTDRPDLLAAVLAERTGRPQPPGLEASAPVVGQTLVKE